LTTVAGEVVDTSAKTATDVEMTAAICDEAGVPYQVAIPTMRVPGSAPGQRTLFKIRPIGLGLNEISRYELFVEGRPTS
jgi:hypothetical protein